MKVIKIYGQNRCQHVEEWLPELSSVTTAVASTVQNC